MSVFARLMLEVFLTNMRVWRVGRVREAELGQKFRDIGQRKSL
jgi:hypothetical protein